MSFEKETSKESAKEGLAGLSYWRSLEELAQDPEVLAASQREFLTQPSDEDDNSPEYHLARRDFIKIMGASIALASTACTKRPVEKIIPYVNKPEGVTPGVANWYASTLGDGSGVLVKTREGRPIKLEGNPEHPLSLGGLTAQGQAAILDLYDPDRLKAPAVIDPTAKTSNESSWEEIDQRIIADLKTARASGSGVRLLTSGLSGTSARLADEFARAFSGGKVVTFDVSSAEDTARAQEMSYGTRVLPRYRFDKARVVVSFGADFIGDWGNSVANQKAWSKTRRLGQDNKRLSKLVAFEPAMTLTGANADVRHPVAPGDQLKVALAIAKEVVSGTGRFSGEVGALLSRYDVAKVAAETGVDAALIKDTARDLMGARGASIVLGGGTIAKGELGIALDCVANLINSALDNEGATIDGTANPTAVTSDFEAFAQLVADMKAGKVSVLLIHGSNPVYALGKVTGFESALKNVGTVVSLTDRLDETAIMSHYACPVSHELESWGDSRPSAGIWSIRQPTIQPLYKTRSFEDSLITWAKALGTGGAIAAHATWYDYLRAAWQNNVQREVGASGSFGMFWDNALREGVVVNRSAVDGGGRARSLRAGSVAAAVQAVPAFASGLKVVLRQSSVGDGRFSNNSWLQELPDPISKITWGNYASVGAALAQKMGLKDGDIVRVKGGDYTIELPAHIQPGNHADAVTIAVGYGRERAGRVGNGVGANAYPFAKASRTALSWTGTVVTLEKTGGVHKLASTQGHHTMEGRAIIKETTYSAYQKDPKAGNKDHHESFTMWPKHEYTGHRWAMAIDLNACTGCGACVIGCQAENNVPVVGYKDILNGREMHWIRIDRYFSGPAENPQVAYQPMTCQQCENAPCETVCPVLAAVHDEEGLNQQIYNRCVGTRYCANNCPYKVRRFNWFTYTDLEKPLNFQYNPEVTVRTRGVMEKCTFCVQRLRDAKHRAKDLGRKVQDGDVQVACQQTCPSDAIVFGDINDKNSRVAKISQDPRGYHVLSELNVRPSITYLTKVRNADKVHAFKQEDHGGGHHS